MLGTSAWEVKGQMGVANIRVGLGPQNVFGAFQCSKFCRLSRRDTAKLPQPTVNNSPTGHTHTHTQGIPKISRLGVARHATPEEITQETASRRFSANVQRFWLLHVRGFQLLPALVLRLSNYLFGWLAVSLSVWVAVSSRCLLYAFTKFRITWECAPLPNTCSAGNRICGFPMSTQFPNRNLTAMLQQRHSAVEVHVRQSFCSHTLDPGGKHAEGWGANQGLHRRSSQLPGRWDGLEPRLCLQSNLTVQTKKSCVWTRLCNENGEYLCSIVPSDPSYRCARARSCFS